MKDDRGSMPMALLVTLVGIGLTATLVPVVVGQIVATRVIADRTQSLDAAQAGIDAALGQLRAATTTVTSSVGELEGLPPCVMTGSQGADGLRYRVTVAYFGLPDDADDPTPKLLGCPPLDVPVSAKLTATGSGVPTANLTGGEQTRTIEATYTFKTNNLNITGGEIRLASTPTTPLCLDGGNDASPARRAPVTMQPCEPGGSSDQRFAYNPDLSIKLVGSERGDAQAGMCLDADLPHANGAAVLFQPCLGRNARQQWSLDDSSRFRGTSDGVNVDNFCLTRGSTGSLVLSGCGSDDNKQIFRPQTGVGAGMASDTTGQLVNYKQFSRCLDVTNHSPTYSYMIVWFCKQSPAGIVSWNQQWKLPPVTTKLADATPERIRTAGAGNPGYCLLAPPTTSGYVTMSPCSFDGPLADPLLKWTKYGDTGNYATSYRIVSHNNYCLTPTDLAVAFPDTHSDGTAKVKVAPCTSSELQKWNAPANFNKPLVLTNTKEK